MNKKFIVIYILLVLMITFNLSVKAGFELQSGVAINLLELTEFNQYLKGRGSYLTNDYLDIFASKNEDDISNFYTIEHGFGLSLTGNYRFNNLAVGNQLELLRFATDYSFADESNDYYKETYRFYLVGLLPSLDYRLLDYEKLRLNINGGVGPYYALLSWREELDLGYKNTHHDKKSYNNWAFGWQIGANGKFKLQQRVNLFLDLRYRSLDFAYLENRDAKKFSNIYNNQTEVVGFDFSSTSIATGVEFVF